MVGAGGVLTSGHDGEVHLVVALFDDPATQVCRHLGFGAADQRDLAALQLSGDPIDSRTGRGERLDLGRVLRHAQRADHLDRTRVLRTWQLRQQFDEETRPHLIAHSDSRGAAGEPGDECRRILRLPPREEVEGPWHFTHPWCLECRDHHRGVGGAGDDQHRQPLQRHRRVAREIRQVVSDRQQQGVDVVFGHRLTHSCQALEVHGRVDGGSAHRASLPAVRASDPFVLQFRWPVPTEPSRKQGARREGRGRGVQGIDPAVGRCTRHVRRLRS